MPSRATERINFGKIKEIVVPPNMIELQTNSYKEFLQADVSPPKRDKHTGLESVFREVFPIESYDGKCVLELRFLRDRRAEDRLAGMPARRPDLWRAALRHLSAQGRSQEREGRKSFHGRTAPDDAAGHVCHQWRGTRRRLANCTVRRASRSRPRSIRTAKCCTASASFPTAVPGMKRSSTRAICFTFISTAKNAAGNF